MNIDNLFSSFYNDTRLSKTFDISKIAFKQQKDFIDDPCTLKALFCTRRAAKSYTDGLYLFKAAIEHPGCNCLYIGLTRLSAMGIIWKDILREIDLKNNLKAQFNNTLLTCTLPNGSVIWVTGADTDEAEMNKLLGKKYKLVIIDEASMFTVNMEQLVYGILKPATIDQGGTIVLSGTASNITRGLFYNITNNKEPGWSLHQWTAYDNPYIASQWAKELQDIKQTRPLFMQTALFRQWYLNEWVIDEDAKVYKFNKEFNTTNALPYDITGWHHVLGVDLGHSPDPSTFVVGCYHDASSILYVRHAEKHLRMDVTDVAEKIKALERTYKFDVRVIDGANKQAVAELNNRHNVNMLPADKLGKNHFINIMNAEFIQRKLMVLDHLTELIDELETLVWVTENGKIKETQSQPRKEHPNLPNNLCDATLYMWRWAYQYLMPSLAKEDKPLASDFAKWEPYYLEKIAEQERAKANPNTLQLDMDPGLFDFDQDDVI